MKITIYFIFIILTISCGQTRISVLDFRKKAPVKIWFNIIPEEISKCEHTTGGVGQIENGLSYVCAVVRETNQSNNALKYEYAPFSWGQNEDNHIEAFDMTGRRVNLDKDIDYQIVLDPDYEEVVNIGDIRENFINILTFLEFRQSGVYALRFVSTEYDSIVYSNWDTLIVRCE